MNFSLCFSGTLSFLLSFCFNTKQGKAVDNSDGSYTLFWGVGGGSEEAEWIFHHILHCYPRELLNVAICLCFLCQREMKKY